MTDFTMKVFLKPPCGGCDDRVIDCHSTCDRYKEYKKELETRKSLYEKDNLKKMHKKY